jgi:tRNA modification GTPase
VLVVVDRSEPLTEDDRRVLDATHRLARVLVKNKGDQPDRCDVPVDIEPAVVVSASLGRGLDVLRATIAHALTGTGLIRDAPAVTNIRHVELLERARASLVRAHDAAAGGASEEFVAADLQDARARFDEIVGKRTSEDVLRHIFERFCIGK